MISYGIGVIVSAFTFFNRNPSLGSLIFRLVTGAGSAVTQTVTHGIWPV